MHLRTDRHNIKLQSEEFSGLPTDVMFVFIVLSLVFFLGMNVIAAPAANFCYLCMADSTGVFYILRDGAVCGKTLIW